MEQLKELLEMLKALVVGKFYGKVEVSFESGKIVNIKETKSIKLKS